MAAFTGIDITIFSKTKTDIDPLGNPIYTTKAETVSNVLVAPATSEDITDSTDLQGGKALYTLAIPKGDTHDWNDIQVQFWGHTWQTHGMPLTGIEANIPLDWNTKILIERVD